MKLSVIIPVFNEEKVVGAVLDDVKRFIRDKGYQAEIIVVDDGSKDKTFDIAKSKDVSVLRHEKNRGYGATLKTGIKASRNEVIVILDGDGSYPVNEISGLLDEIDGSQMVIGARTKKDVKMSFLRKIPKFLLGRLAEYLVKEKIPDINSGLRVFKRSMYEEYANILPDTFSFTLTITLAAIANHKRIKFVPISYYKRKGVSKIRPIHDTLNFVLLIIKTILYFNPIRVFLPAAGIFVFAALAIALYSIFAAGRFLDVTVTLLFIFGVQLIVLGLIADLINRRVG
ncbi:glycosyltransferase [Omnitrophica bacterium]|nr:glycosyltransferase [Candidatus Omnitrophota bacterium]